jgi:hypothetical protein
MSAFQVDAFLSSNYDLSSNDADADAWIGYQPSQDLVYSSSRWPSDRLWRYQPFVFQEIELTRTASRRSGDSGVTISSVGTADSPG